MSMLPVMMSVLPLRGVVNLSHPLKATQWLRLLEPDLRYGLRFHPHLDIDKKLLGFSFQSNSLGFRGPAAGDGKAMLLGTSFAMGLSVNNGLNWYDEFLDPNEWLNCAMPVGPRNQLAVVEDFYGGEGHVLLYIYHPNLWRTAQNFENAAKKGVDIFTHLGWKTRRRSMLTLYPQWLAKEVAKLSMGKSVYRNWGGRWFYLNAVYNFLDIATGADLVGSCIELLNAVFSRFSKVIVIRSPIKEDSVPKNLRTPRLNALNENYEFYWEMFRASFGDHVHCYRLDHTAFGPEHFLPFDTHWSAEGNLLFREMISPILMQEKLGHLLIRKA